MNIRLGMATVAASLLLVVPATVIGWWVDPDIPWALLAVVPMAAWSAFELIRGLFLAFRTMATADGDWFRPKGGKE